MPRSNKISATADAITEIVVWTSRIVPMSPATALALSARIVILVKDLFLNRRPIEVEITDVYDGWQHFNEHMLKKYRKHAGFTQKELGERIGVSASTISVWENASRTENATLPNAEQIRKLCLVLQMRPDVFLGLKVRPL